MCKCIISCVKPAGNCLVAADLLAVEIVFWNIAPSAGRQSNRQEHAMWLQLSELYHMTNDYIFTLFYIVHGFGIKKIISRKIWTDRFFVHLLVFLKRYKNFINSSLKAVTSPDQQTQSQHVMGICWLPCVPLCSSVNNKRKRWLLLLCFPLPVNSQRSICCGYKDSV